MMVQITYRQISRRQQLQNYYLMDRSSGTNAGQQLATEDVKDSNIDGTGFS